MRLVNEEYIRTIQHGARAGTLIKKEYYEEIKDFFLRLLDRENLLTMNNLLEKGHERFSHVLKFETGWYLYNVKLDMEARGLITHIIPDAKGKRALISKSQIAEQVVSEIDRPYQNTHSRAALTRMVLEKYRELFGKNPLMVHAPGRINLIGEHTDYNNGFVLPAAIDKGIQFAIAPSSSETLIYSIRYKQFLSVDLKNIQPSKNSEWHNYLLGVLYRLQQKGHLIKPFTCVFDGDLPSGAGLSSSAAMACGFIIALNRLFNLKLSPIEMIQVAQWSERHFVGVKCGIMDQFASMMGKEDHVIQLDCKTLEYTYHPLQLGSYCLLLCDTNVKHTLASSEYNMRREECDRGMSILRKNYPRITSLRDVKPEMLEACKGIMPRTVFNRCRYVVEENTRVLEATKDLRKGDLKSFGEKMYKTHEGLSKLYEVSCAELDFLVGLTRSYPGIVGSRMMGGGFGGCTLNLIEHSALENFMTDARAVYKEKFNLPLNFHIVKTGKGANVTENIRDLES